MIDINSSEIEYYGKKNVIKEFGLSQFIYLI